jgi:hypothetical protein
MTNTCCFIFPFFVHHLAAPLFCFDLFVVLWYIYMISCFLHLEPILSVYLIDGTPPFFVSSFQPPDDWNE